MIHIDLLNKGSLHQTLEEMHHKKGLATRNIISQLLSGGTYDPELLKIFNNSSSPLPFDEGIPILFLSELHKHPGIKPDVFLEQWGNKNIPELTQLMHTSASDTASSISLFIHFLNKINFPMSTVELKN